MALHEYIPEFRKQLEKGNIQKVYRDLTGYILSLKTYLKSNYPDYCVSGNLYQGYLDMTYFAFTPKTLKDLGLKIAVVFVYETFRFEVWLAGYNKQVQKEYWEIFSRSHWNRYPVVSTTKGHDAVVESVLAENPDFQNLDDLTRQIEKKTLKFIEDIENFLAVHHTN